MAISGYGKVWHSKYPADRVTHKHGLQKVIKKSSRNSFYPKTRLKQQDCGCTVQQIDKLTTVSQSRVSGGSHSSCSISEPITPSEEFSQAPRLWMALDGFSAAASVVALIETSLKVVSLCAKYYSHVKDAKKDIDLFSLEVQAFIKVLQNLDQIARNPGATRLFASRSFSEEIQRCLRDLERLQKKLDPGKGRKTMSRYGIRALKWPFESRELEKDIGVLERYKSTFNAALNMDQT